MIRSHQITVHTISRISLNYLTIHRGINGCYGVMLRIACVEPLDQANKIVVTQSHHAI